jgi:predicted unusual protein kinase regulating ubiquinone biosynthesis (AarF/ABC1/UbiB family)
MKKKNINLKEIGKLFSQIVVKMIHREGFVHADPHAGNLKVRINNKN